RHRRTGHLFQGRYKAILIEKDSHLLEVCRYVVLNPVRARVVEEPGDWKWSSYRATSGRENPHLCLTRDWILGQLSKTREKAEKEYRQFVKGGIGKETIWTDLKGQTILGEDKFVDSLIEHLRKRKDIPDIPKSQRYANRPSLEKIFPEGILRDKGKRNKKIIEAVEKYGYRQREIADYLGMYFTSVSRIMKREGE
ncbi:MAG: addiction module toxin RelE, partial [Deltaproteobacteria bacterium GWB2_42_7]